MASSGEGFSTIQQAPAQFNLTFVDFVPSMLKAPGFASSPKYERFDCLVRRANEWLQQNPHVRVTTCESIETKCKPSSKQDINTIKSTFTEWGAMCYIRCLRLWVSPRGPHDPPGPTSLGYINAMPACTDPGGFLSNPKFEKFGDTIVKLNQILRERPLPGKILNIETQDMKFKTWGNEVDPDKSYWYEYGKETVFYLNVIRVFYEGGPPAYEEIGCADFIPSRTKQDGFFKSGEFEPLHNVVGKARAWAQSQPGLHVVNVQSMDYKLKQGWSGESLDTQRSMYYELGRGITYYIRIVRLCYVRSATHAPPPSEPPRPPLTLSYRTFAPCMTTTGGTFSDPEYELQTDTMKRAIAWLAATGARVLCAETVTVRMYSGHQHGNAEQTYTYNPGNRAERHMFVLRIFLDGDYAEPPREALPPPPVVQESSGDGCCALM